MLDSLLGLVTKPHPLRSAAKRLIHDLRLGSYERRLDLGCVDRAHYGYLVRGASRLASRLGIPEIAVLEFGVAGGNGLVSFQDHARELAGSYPVSCRIYGFDTGGGLPPPRDYRDLPYHWKPGFFPMDRPALEARLGPASALVLGDVKDTVSGFFAEYDPPPVGAISFDVDYYSSTRDALALLAGDPTRFLPRVFTYFDDTIGGEVELYGDHTGQRLAIHEFNAAQDDVKLSPAYYLTTRKEREVWYHQIYIAHFLRHPRYGDFVSEEGQALDLERT